LILALDYPRCEILFRVASAVRRLHEAAPAPAKIAIAMLRREWRWWRRRQPRLRAAASIRRAFDAP
jgi:hypothetical protein